MGRAFRTLAIVLASAVAVFLLSAQSTQSPVMGMAATTTALKYLGPGQYQMVIRAGRKAPGDVPPLSYNWSGAANCAVPDDAAQIQPMTGTGCWNGNPDKGVWDARQFGVDATGMTDSTAALNTALAHVKSVFLPPGTYHVTDEIKCPGGRVLRGAGAGTTTILVGNTAGNDFNMSANGVVRLGTANSQAACTVDDFSIGFVQPDFAGMTLADIIPYPEALDGDNIHADNGATWGAHGITIQRAWKCLSVTGSSWTPGGSLIGRISCSSFNAGLTLANNSAIIDVKSWDQETFGLDGNQVAVYEACGAAQSCFAMVATPRPATHVDYFGTFAQPVELQGMGSGGGVPSNPSIAFGTLNLDSDGATLVVPNGTGNMVAQIGSLYSSKGLADAATASINIQGSATLVQITNFFMRASQMANVGPDVLAANGATLEMANGYYYINSTQPMTGLSAQTGGLIRITGSILSAPQSPSRLADASGGAIDIATSRIQPANPTYTELTTEGAGGSLTLQSNRIAMPNVLPTAPLIAQTDAQGTVNVSGNLFSGASGAALGAPVLSLTADLGANYISENKLAGWGVTLPFNTSAGYYNINDYEFPLTATTTFATPGDYGEASQTTTGMFQRRGNFAVLALDKKFTPNYTTAAGAFQISLPNAPLPAASGVLPYPCALGKISNVTYAAGQIPSMAMGAGATLVPSMSASASLAVPWGAPNIVSGTAGIEIVTACQYTVR
ncbi:MAG TPA: glycosyl hydrolase family 28-related protein [Stellaceae bacterium]|jgi:hypothetical protein